VKHGESSSNDEAPPRKKIKTEIETEIKTENGATDTHDEWGNRCESCGIVDIFDQSSSDDEQDNHNNNNNQRDRAVGLLFRARKLARNMTNFADSIEKNDPVIIKHGSLYNFPDLGLFGQTLTPLRAYQHPAYLALEDWLKNAGNTGRMVVKTALANVEQKNGERLEDMEKAISKFTRK
jgi:hypothetical protein